MNTNSARMISAIRPAVMRSPSFADERGGAPDLEHVDAFAGLDDFVVIVGPRGPDLAVQLHTADALSVRDALHDGRRLPHERRGTGSCPTAAALMAGGDRAQRGEQDHRDDEERRPLDRRSGAGGRKHRRNGRAAREWSQEQAHGADLTNGENY